MAGREGAAAPIAPRRSAFDASLGTDSVGRLVATYSRCNKEAAEQIDTLPSVPAMATARGCDVYRYSLADGNESRLEISRPGSTELLPSSWLGRLAFVRMPDDSSRRSVEPRVYLRSKQRTRRVSSTPRGYIEPDFSGGWIRSVSFTGPGPISLSLRGGQLSYTWGYYSRTGECGPEVPKDDRAPATITVHRSATLAGRTRSRWSVCDYGPGRRLLAGATGTSFTAAAIAEPNDVTHVLIDRAGESVELTTTDVVVSLAADGHDLFGVVGTSGAFHVMRIGSAQGW